MSRRKQSNPKPVKRDDLPGGMEEESLNGDTKSSAISDEEDIEEDGVSLTNSSPSPSDAGKSVRGRAKRRRETDSDADASPLPPPPPPPPLPPPPPAASSASPHPLLSADLIQSLQYFALLRQSLPNGSLMSVAAPPAPPPLPPGRAATPPPPAAPVPPIKSSAAALNHTCPSCGICFSSASTLSAHVTYYCSKRPPVAPVVNESIVNQTDALQNGRSQTPELPDDVGDRPSAPKIRRSGRYYACPYCSFSADKRVSLNRHMRVHVGLPLLATHPVSPPPPLPVDSPRSVASDSGKAGDDPDRYCAECKIQFSSFKTFQVHKQHYCQSRKPVAPGSPLPDKAAPLDGHGQRVQHADAANGQMTILVLPTHPPIVIPLSILQSARLLTPEQPIPHQAVIVSPLGEIQFRSESPEESKPTAPPAPPSSSAPTPAPTPAPVRAQQASPVGSQTLAAPLPASPALGASAPAPAPGAPAAPPAEPKADTALDLSAKGAEQETPALETPKEVGSIRIREELAHVSPADAQPALPFLPPKVFAELEALGMCLGVPSGHDMTANPAQWLAMLENAVLQASLNPAAASALLPPASKPEMIAQPRPSSAIPCEECNISFRRMESYLVHKQYYCAARHQAPPAPVKEATQAQPAPEAVNGSEEPPLVQRPAKVACPQCGIEFESAVVLQAHRTFYCPKRDALDPVKVAPSKAGQDAPSQNNGASPTAGGSGSAPAAQGWKCPCCDVVSPTAAAAQKHIETHSNVRAFRCTVCGYRGNTLRGMRTHVRIHFDRRNADLCEDNYIACIMGGGGGGGGNEPGSPPDVDQLLKSLGIPPELCAKLFSAGNPAAQEAVAALMAAAGRDRRELTNSSLAGLQFLQLAQRLANHSPGPTTGAGCRSDKLFLCDLCCYSSSYRGNVIRHSKLVHGREVNDVAVVSSNFLQQAVNNNPTKPGFPDSSLVNRKPATEHSSPPPPLPPARPGLVGTPSSVRLASSGSPDEAIQVKIDPDDVMLMSSTGGSSSSGGHSPTEPNDYAHQAASAVAPAGEAFRKHCKACNITFTYMNTFLAHKKYYCSSQTADDDQDRDGDLHHSDRDLRDEDEMDDEDDEVKAVTAAPSPPRPASAQRRSEATPT